MDLYFVTRKNDRAVEELKVSVQAVEAMADFYLTWRSFLRPR